MLGPSPVIRDEIHYGHVFYEYGKWCSNFMGLYLHCFLVNDGLMESSGISWNGSVKKKFTSHLYILRVKSTLRHKEI